MRLTRSAAFAIALTALVAAGQACAQDGAAQAPSKDQAATETGDAAMPWGMGSGMMGFGGGGMGMGMGMMRGHRHHSMCAAMNSDIEGRLAYLRAELKITQQQEPLWTAFAAAERDGAKAMTDHCKTMFEKRAAGGALSLPDRLDRHEQMMAAELDTMRALGKALKPLYATFSDSQKETAEDLFWGPFGVM